MSTITKKELEEQYNILTSKILEVLEVFNDYYGEDRVDLQNFKSFEVIELMCDSYIKNHLNTNIEDLIEFIKRELNRCELLVYFPKVKVTNEYDKFTYITELYVKVKITWDGRILGSFTFNRAEYTLDQMLSSYLHSHAPNIPYDDFSFFTTTCLGTGPIRSTIANLSVNFDRDYWSLFCLELDKYTQVESIEGTPYRRLENIGVGNNMFRAYDNLYNSISIPFSTQYTKVIKAFIRYFLSNNSLKYKFIKSNYKIGMSNKDLILYISNAFIKWYNAQYGSTNGFSYSQEDLISRNILKECKIIGNTIYASIDGRRAFDIEYCLNFEGAYVCTFKGERKNLKIINNSTNTEENVVLLLSKDVISYIVTLILKLVNLLYGENYTTIDSEGKATFDKKIAIF